MLFVRDKNCVTGVEENASGEVNVIIFDFDGTLVQSNRIKLQAWYDLFDGDNAKRALLPGVLERHGEASRYIIIRKLLERAGDEQLSEDQLSEAIADYARRYNKLVLEGVKTCPEMPSASDVLDELFTKVPLYCSSHTPETELLAILHFRGWSRYFKGIFGYPRVKSETVKYIVATEQVFPDEVLVVGDGLSDREAAEIAGARFFSISGCSDVRSLLQYCHYVRSAT